MKTSSSVLSILNWWSALLSMNNSPDFDVKKIPSPLWAFGAVVSLPLRRSWIASSAVFALVFEIMLLKTPIPWSRILKMSLFLDFSTSMLMVVERECSIALLSISEKAYTKMLWICSGACLMGGNFCSIS